MRKLPEKFLLVLCFLILPFKSQAQVEFSGLAGMAFNSGSVNHHPDSTGTAPVIFRKEPFRLTKTVGFALALEASLPMKYGFRLRAGTRLLYKKLVFDQDYNFPGYKIKNQWFVNGFSLEAPVHLSYPIIDRRFQVTVGAGLAAVKNWINYKSAGTRISGSGFASGGNISNPIFVDFVTNQYQPGKNTLSLAGELSTEISFSSFPRLSLGILWHKDFLKQLGQLTYENKYSQQAGSFPQAFARSKGSFEIEKPAYFMVQLKYTFAGKPKEKEEERENSDFEEDGSE